LKNEPEGPGLVDGLAGLLSARPKGALFSERRDLPTSSGLWECGKLAGLWRASQGLRETVENRNAPGIARKRRERFSTGFLTPVISIALLVLLHAVLFT
jgi:hypothetical protein